MCQEEGNLPKAQERRGSVGGFHTNISTELYIHVVPL